MTRPDGHTRGGICDDPAAACRPEPSARPGSVVYDPSGALFVRLIRAGERTRAVVVGEVDLASAPTLEGALHDALRRRPRALYLDLERVAFFDCAGLNVLLRTRALARRTGAALTVSAAGPAVERILSMTGTRPLFDPPDTSPAEDTPVPGRFTPPFSTLEHHLHTVPHHPPAA